MERRFLGPIRGSGQLQITPYSRVGGQAPSVAKRHFEEVDSGDTPAPPNRVAASRKPALPLAPCYL